MTPTPWAVRVSRFVPAWMRGRPALGFENFAKTLFSWALLCDVALQAATELAYAAFPGADGRTDNLDLIAAGRGLVQGETETPQHFATRLRAWLVAATQLGSEIGLATQLHEFIAGNPQVRVISRSGRFVTVLPDGAVSLEQGAWNWDGRVTPSRAACWWDAWVVIYPTSAAIFNGYYVEDVGIWGDGGSGLAASEDAGWDHHCTRAEVDTILSLVRQWKGAHVNVRTIVWSYGADYYAPTPVSGSPDGTWGLRFDQSTNSLTRNTTDAYWDVGQEYA